MPSRIIRSGRTAVRRGGRRRTSTWARTHLTIAALGAAASQNVDLWADLEVAGSSVVGATVLRTLVLLHVQNWGAVTDEIQVGMIIEDKGDVGAVVPLAASRNLDWYWYSTLYPVSSGAAVSVASLMPSTGVPLDVRSRRSVKDMGRTSMLCFQNSSAAAKAIDIEVDQLIALP